MPPRGQKPKPTIAKRLAGNPGRRPLNEQEPIPPALDTWAAPPELAAIPEARAEWERLAPMLRTCRQITAADRSALAALCIEWARYLDAERHVATEGAVVLKGSASAIRVTNPYLVVAHAALRACARLWPELGLTPSSRSRVTVPPIRPGEAPADEAPDPFAEFDRPPGLIS